jgi:hypothetical protein
MTEGQVSAPLFKFGDSGTVAADRLAGVSFGMTGPGESAAAGHLPVRGDLAHIRLAGRYFVPHYAVPMPHRVKAPGVTLRKSDKTEAEAIEELAAGATFNVLDITGGWAWGQEGEDGFVGYLPMEALAAI